MKYNTISTSSLASEGKKSTFYADLDIPQSKIVYSEEEMQSIRGELEIVQKALKLQTKRCRQLVAEYTRRLQEKEAQYQSEKSLRDDQLAKVLKALLIFEARLKQEQKFISHQLNEKDYIIKKQNSDIKKLLASQYCKNCNQYYAASPLLESLDSSSEYVVTDYQDYQSSNFESLDSSSETYATISERTSNKSDNESCITETTCKSDPGRNIYQKNRNKDSLGKRSKKIPHRKSIGTYFEVLKLRNDSPMSNEDNTSADYDNLDSLPPESVSDKISLVSENIQSLFNKNEEVVVSGSESSANVSLSECNSTVINKNLDKDSDVTAKFTSSKDNITNGIVTDEEESEENTQQDATENKLSKISESIPVFEGDGESNDNWYASASDQEDEERRDIYRNNPVLECMNQILLQNMNDLNSPPKTPTVERKTSKNKRVKFSDEEDKLDEKPLTQENVKEKQDDSHDYYETPVQKTPNFYETPQSIYSNDYEQILSKCSETFSQSEIYKITTEDKVGHHYIDMETKSEIPVAQENNIIVRKSKILRTPPALPPKPPNLVSKYKIQTNSPKSPTELTNRDFEPDYCSISELNLPQNKNVSAKKINVVAEINSPTSLDVMSKLNAPSPVVEKMEKVIKNTEEFNHIVVNESAPNLIVKKCVEKMNIQLAKQTPIKAEANITLQATPSKKNEPEIPKLPQVSEILIPEENEEKQEERISHDNYVKNNSQIFKTKTIREPRKPIVMGSSVSSLISGFNNHQILSEIKKKHDKNKVQKLMFSSFENLQNLDKHFLVKDNINETPNFENFDLSQNFEEFKLDDCEIEEYNVEDELNEEENVDIKQSGAKLEPVCQDSKPHDQTKQSTSSTRVDLIRATNDMVMPNLNLNSIELLKRQLELQKNRIPSEELLNENPKRADNEPTYEHFLECTGLSSKSIVTPSRLLSNHKSMLKPKDVKLRSKVKANNGVFERYNGPAIKYWSEPYI